MELLTQKQFSFTLAGLPEATFDVVQFSGEEGLSQLYQFELLLVSRQLDLDLQSMLNRAASLVIHRDGLAPVLRRGILCDLEQLQAVAGTGLYRAHLVPRLWWLTQTRHQQVFLDQSVPAFLEAVLRAAGLDDGAFRFRLQRDYPPEPFVVQYRESHWQFLSRWLEREGVTFFFLHQEAREQVVFTDHRLGHPELPQGSQGGQGAQGLQAASDRDLVYHPEAGLMGTEAAVQVFSCRRQLVPGTVLVKDYDYEQPSLDLEGQLQVDALGQGQVYLYGEHFQTPAEGLRLAEQHKEALLCVRSRCQGASTAAQLSAGFRFRLAGHFRADCNRGYLAVQVRHEGSQAGYLTGGLAATLSDPSAVFYRNTFQALPDDLQFRPARQTAWPRIAGTISAWIDGAGLGEHAELDAQGRYKVLLPFDLSGRKDGKASTYIRMSQPYAGSREGLHFPLLRHTEVLLSFIDGNPDRPVITGAVPNARTPSPVHSSNPSANRIVTAAQNELRLEDQSGQEQILMHVPAAASYVAVGNAVGLGPAAAGPGEVPVHGVQIRTDHQVWIQSGAAGGPGTLMVLGALPRPEPGAEPVDPDLQRLRMRAGAGPPVNWRSHQGPAYLYQQGRQLRLAKGGSYSVDLADTNLEDRCDEATLKTGFLAYPPPEGTAAGSTTQRAPADFSEWQSIDGGRFPAMRAGNTLVHKSYGNSYEYRQGDSVQVSQGNSQTLLYGGQHVDQEFTETGVKFSDSSREIGAKHITTTTTTTRSFAGAMTSYAYSHLTAACRFFLETKFGLAPQVTVATETTPAPITSVSVSVSPKVQVELSASLGFKLTGGVGLELHVITKQAVMSYNNSSGSFQMEGPGTEVERAAKLKLQVMDLMIGAVLTELKQTKMELGQCEIRIRDSQLVLEKSDLTMLM